MATKTQKNTRRTSLADESEALKTEVATEDNNNAITKGNQSQLSLSKPLTTQEKELLAELEQTVYTLLNKAAFALKEISDLKLYRESHERFEDYCEEQLNISRRFASYQINFARITEELKKEQDVPFLPTSESQVRALAKLKPELRKTIWLESCNQAGGKVPSRETVQSVVKQASQIEQYEPIEKDACVFIVRASIESSKNLVGYWGFVDTISKNNTYTVVLPQKKLTGVPREALRSLKLESKKLHSSKELFEQLKAIYDSNSSHESVVKELLQYFGKKKEPIETTLEKDLIHLLHNAVCAASANDPSEIASGERSVPQSEQLPKKEE